MKLLFSKTNDATCSSIIMMQLSVQQINLLSCFNHCSIVASLKYIIENWCRLLIGIESLNRNWSCFWIHISISDLLFLVPPNTFQLVATFTQLPLPSIATFLLPLLVVCSEILRLLIRLRDKLKDNFSICRVSIQQKIHTNQKTFKKNKEIEQGG